ncbi:uncharacterized protein LOC107368908 [Tetranychus urticae]|uniref:Uncharacterized protein n=1 Tax=Tetranychus urticae TaxID=32264 RepID=T1L045_TETUR|nr:uncharacterized protein LOC107368908 [Tetranychus urticae]
MLFNQTGKYAFSKLKIGVMAVLGGGVIFYNPLVNSLGLSSNEKLHSLKSADNKLVAVPYDLHQFADDIRKDVKMLEKKKMAIKFFIVKSLDVITLGYLDMAHGARVGLPYTFIYDKEEDVDPAVVTSIVGEKRFIDQDWYKSENGQKLIRTIILSKEARKFAIARGIIHADSIEAILIDFFTLFMVASTIAAYSLMESKMILLFGKAAGLTILSVILACTLIPVFVTIKSIIAHDCMMRSDDRTLKQPNNDYRLGAIEYYEKLIERNKLMRELLVDGPERYNEDGSPFAAFKKVVIPLKDRLTNCKNVIEEWEKETPVIIQESL